MNDHCKLYRKGTYVAVRNFDDNYYIAQCKEVIPTDSISSNKDYSVAWLDKIGPHRRGLLYGYSYEDKIFKQSIVCAVNLNKISRFRFILDFKEEKKILSLLSKSEDGHSTPSSPIIKERKELSDFEILHNETQSLFNGPLIDISEEGFTKFCLPNKHSELENKVETVTANIVVEDSITASGSSPNENVEQELVNEQICTSDIVTANIVVEDLITASDPAPDENVEQELVTEQIFTGDIVATNIVVEDSFTASGIPPDENVEQELVNKQICTNYIEEPFSELESISKTFESTNFDKRSTEIPSSYHDFSSSESEYVPPSATSNDSEEDLLIETCRTLTLPCAATFSGTDKRMKKRKFYSDSESENENVIVIKPTKKTGNCKRVYDKKHVCYFCNKLVCKITRHLECVHANEMEVAKLLAMDSTSLERKEGFTCILRAGDYYHNCEVLQSKAGELILVRRPSVSEQRIHDYRDFGPCPECLGFMLKDNLWHHVKYACPKKTALSERTEKTIVSRRDRRTESAALICHTSTTGPEFKKNILCSLKSDEISKTCINDQLITKLGALFFEKFSRHQYDQIRQTMRQLGRLLIEMGKIDVGCGTIQSCILPKNFDNLIMAVKRLCISQRNEIQAQRFGIPSLALKLGHSLRKCSLIARGIALKRGDFVMDKQMEAFAQLMNIEWNSRVSSAALRTLHEKKMNATQLLPITDDLLKLNQYLEDIITNLCGRVHISKDLQQWSKLASATLCRIILFNKRRSGEASRITLDHYACRPNWSEQCTSELKDSLTPLENTLASRLTIVEVPGKSRVTMKVPILMTNTMKLAIDKLIATRKTVGIANDNIYIFARGGDSLGYMRGADCLRSFCKEANLSSSRTITSTKLRKYIATVVQIFDLKENEYDWLARHLGHDIRVHRQFYRLHESAVELTKVSRILLALDKGDAAKFQGKPLEDIQVDDLPNIEDSDESALSSDEEINTSIYEKENQEEGCSSTSGSVKSKRKNKKPESMTSKTVVKTPWIIDSSSDEARNISIHENEGQEEGCNSALGNVKPRRKNKKPKFKSTVVKKPWTNVESAAVLNFFRVFIKKHNIPGKEKCLECINKSEGVLQARKWTDIKFYIKNYLTKINKQKKLN